MFIVGKYPRFLKKHWKLIEFLHEKHAGVQDMSIETLEEICQQCGEKFIRIQENDRRIFLKELIEGMHANMCKDLEKEQIQNLYRVCGRVIAKEKNQLNRNNNRNNNNNNKLQYPQLIDNSLKQPNDEWKSIMNAAAQNNGMILMQQRTIIQVLYILRISCNCSWTNIFNTMPRLYNDLINVYKYYGDKTKEFSNQRQQRQRQ